MSEAVSVSEPVHLHPRTTDQLRAEASIGLRRVRGRAQPGALAQRLPADR